jgi:hypothetical protein
MSIFVPLVYFVTCILKLTFIKILNLNRNFFLLAIGRDRSPPPQRSVKDKAYPRSQVVPSR